MMSISDIPTILSPISSTTSIQGLQTSMNNNNSNNSGTNSVSTSPHAYSLDRYHEPSTNEKFKRGNSTMSNNNNGLNSNNSKNMSLPPISSFDNLIRAAEKQYASTTTNTTMDQSQVSLSATTSMTSLPLTNNSTSVLPHPLQQGVMTPVGSRTNMLSYQLSTEQRHRAPITRNILQQNQSHLNNMDIRSESNRSLLTSPTDSISRTSISSSSSSSNNSTTTNKSITNDYKLTSPQHSEPIISRNSNPVTKITKPRKKKQCPICLNYYANLSTHKSTHLTPEDRPHRCPICERGFARNNDLIRHRKRHWKDELMSPATTSSLSNNSNTKDDKSVTNDQSLSKQSQLRSLHQIKGTFKCPFNSTLIKLDMEIYPHKNKILPFETSNCHQTGVFSRCDTYKNHLKALHFEYPPGTKKKDRSIVPGKCKHCGAKFENVDTWLNNHVGKNCGYIYH